jgi:hypothetical protein
MSILPPSHLTSCTPTRSNLYLASSLETVFRDPTLYKLLTFNVPNLISVFYSWSRLYKESVQVRGYLEVLITSYFLILGVVNPTPSPQLEDHPCYLSATAYSIYSQLTCISGGRSSIRTPRTSHAVGTGTPPNMVTQCARTHKILVFFLSSIIMPFNAHFNIQTRSRQIMSR